MAGELSVHEQPLGEVGTGAAGVRRHQSASHSGFAAKTVRCLIVHYQTPGRFSLSL